MENYSIQLEQKLIGHLERVWCVRWHPNGKWLTSCGADRTIRIWALDEKPDNDEPQWKCLSVLEDAHERTIRYIAWSNDGRFLASASFDGTTCIWHQRQCNDYNENFHSDSNNNKNDWTVLFSLEGHENEVKCVSWSPSDTFLATCSRDKSVWIWEKIEMKHNSGDNPNHLNDHDQDEVLFECSSVQTEHNQDVKCVRWHPKLDILISSSFDNMINFYCQGDDDWYCYAQLTEHESTVWSMDFNKQGTRLVSVSADETIKIWQPNDYNQLIDELDQSINVKKYAELTTKWTVIASLSGYHKYPIYDVSWSSFLNCILTVGADNSIHVFKEFENDQAEKFSPVRYRQICHLNYAHEQDVNSVHWHPMDKVKTGNNRFATGSDDGCIHIWKFLLSKK